VRYHGFRRVPAWITTAIDAASSDVFEVAASRLFATTDDIVELAHLGVSANLGSVSLASESVLPQPTRGRWSRWNVEGRVVVLRDLPKIDKIFSWTSPNFGDPSKGYHTIIQSRQVWQRHIRFGQSIPIVLSLKADDDYSVRIVARVDRLFDRRRLDGDDLLLAISLLQENFGAVNIRPSDRGVEEWAAAQAVKWELLPPGDGARVPTFDAVKRHFRLPDDDERTRIASERYRQIIAMNPSSTIVGSAGFARYLGFRFREDLIALENLDYGNAIYLMYNDWEDLSKRSRTELLASTDAHYDRIRHTAGWQERLRQRLILKGHAVE
jgi:hypothetical protein